MQLPLSRKVSVPEPTPLRVAGDGNFQFAVVGPPGVYAILASTDLAAWNKLATLTNQEGFVRFFDESTRLSPQKFYRAVSVP